MATSTAFNVVGLDRTRDATMSLSPSGSFSANHNQTIDLTGEDDDDDEDMDEVDTSAVDERHTKRQRTGLGTHFLISIRNFCHIACRIDRIRTSASATICFVI